MLKTRIVTVILASGRQAVKGKEFGWKRPISQLAATVRVMSSRMVDEIALLDVSGNAPDCATVELFSGSCFAPLLVGGGIRHIEQITDLLRHGADKIAINTAAVETPELIEAAAHKIGRQSVVVSVDVRGDPGTVHIRGATEDTGLDPEMFARAVEALGAGEILLNRVERDGTLEGYDLDLIARVASAVSIPVTAVGGAGCYQDFVDAVHAGAHGVAAGAMWSFTDQTPAAAAAYLVSNGLPARRHG